MGFRNLQISVKVLVYFFKHAQSFFSNINNNITDVAQTDQFYGLNDATNQ